MRKISILISYSELRNSQLWKLYYCAKSYKTLLKLMLFLSAFLLNVCSVLYGINKNIIKKLSETSWDWSRGYVPSPSLPAGRLLGWAASLRRAGIIKKVNIKVYFFLKFLLLLNFMLANLSYGLPSTWLCVLFLYSKSRNMFAVMKICHSVWYPAQKFTLQAQLQ